MAAPERPAFYALGSGRAAELLTLLHPPYTLWHLSYYALGAALAPRVYGDRVIWGLVAFALAVGVAAHALDELHDRPLRTALSDRVLVLLAVFSSAGALAIGIVGVVIVSVRLLPLVVAGALFLPAYNLELAGGRFHGDRWFALGWGAFPAFTGYFANAEQIRLPGILIALGCFLLSAAQRRLSTPARELRRRTQSVSGTRMRSDGSSEALSRERLLAPLDRALAALSLAVFVAACAARCDRARGERRRGAGRGPARGGCAGEAAAGVDRAPGSAGDGALRISQLVAERARSWRDGQRREHDCQGREGEPRRIDLHAHVSRAVRRQRQARHPRRSRLLASGDSKSHGEDSRGRQSGRAQRLGAAQRYGPHEGPLSSRHRCR